MTRFSPSAIFPVGLALVVACSGDRPTQPALHPDVPTAIAPSVSGAGAQIEQIVAGDVIVKLKPNTSAQRVAARHGVGVGSAMSHGFAVLRTTAGNERALARRLGADADIVFAEPNFLRQPTSIRPELWAFSNAGGRTMRITSGKSKGATLPSSYASLLDADEDNIEGYGAGGNAVVIGSLDSGVDFTHPEFTGRLIAGRDWVGNDADPSDEDGHGTHTTGTMAGSTVGVAGVSGAAPNVRVYVQRVCGRRGCPTSAIVSAIYAAADYPGMVAMNLSLGGTSESQAEDDAIQYATNKGVLVIASAGNGGTGSVSCPACDPNAVSVAATNWRDALASYSNYGPGLDIAAPGGECYSNTTQEGCIYSAFPGGGYAWMQGTSMAAPQVTGTAAVVASKTGLTGAALRDRLLSTTDNIGSATYFGAGRLNSYRAVTGTTLPAGQ